MELIVLIRVGAVRASDNRYRCRLYAHKAKLVSHRGPVQAVSSNCSSHSLKADLYAICLVRDIRGSNSWNDACSLADGCPVSHTARECECSLGHALSPGSSARPAEGPYYSFTPINANGCFACGSWGGLLSASRICFIYAKGSFFCILWCLF